MRRRYPGLASHLLLIVGCIALAVVIAIAVTR